MVLCDRSALVAGEIAGIDGFLDRHHAGARLAGAEPDQDLVALRQGPLVQPENARAQTSRVARIFTRMRNDVAALDEELAVERDADRAPGALRRRQRRCRPALDG